jgi:hypothetical protein
MVMYVCVCVCVRVQASARVCERQRVRLHTSVMLTVIYEGHQPSHTDLCLEADEE